MSNCKRCNKRLKMRRSIDNGYGPVCKRKHEEAEFLKLQVTIDEELEYQKKVAK